jgi:hypothetical protein
MRLSSGGKSRIEFLCFTLLTNSSITKLMGDSFRLHAQALIGYEDDIEASDMSSTPSMISQGADDMEDSVY